MLHVAGLVFISVGLFLDVIGCLGLVRLPDIYNRLQASTKCVATGTACILFGTFLFVGFKASGTKAILCMIFLLITSPVIAHAISRSAHISGVKLWDESAADEYRESRDKNNSRKKAK